MPRVDLTKFRERIGLLKVAWSSPTMREAALGLGRRLFFEPSQVLVPVDTGRLKKSGKIKITGRDNNIGVQISYDTPYAVYVHENPFARHEEPTQWKFITDPIDQNKAAFMRGLKGAYLQAFARRKK